MSRFWRPALFAAVTAGFLAASALVLAPSWGGRRLLPLLSPAGGALSAQEVSGDLLRGVSLSGARFQRPGLAVFARRVTVKLSWKALLRRRWGEAVDRLIVEELGAQWRAPSGPRRAQGVSATLTGSAGTWRWRATGRFRGALWASGGLWSAGRWSGWAALSELDAAALWPAVGGRVGALSARVDARGLGAPNPASARASWRARERGGIAIGGTAALEGGLLSWEGAVSSGATGRFSGSYRLSDRSLDARARLSAADLPARRGVAGTGLKLEAAASGAMPAPVWRLKALAGGLRLSGLSARSFSADLSGQGKSRFEAHAEARGVEGLGRRIERLEGRAAGTPAAHAVWLAGASALLDADARGLGAWKRGQWSARWESLRLTRAREVWSVEPFATGFGQKNLWVEGLRLTDGQAFADLSARRRGSSWTAFDCALSGFDPQPWALAGLWTSPLRGKLSARLRLAGDLHAPEGAVSAELAEGRFGDLDLGRFELAARLDGRVARLDRFDWTLGGGGARASGTAPLKLGGAAPADFDLRVRARGLDLSAAASRLKAVGLRAPVLDADLRARRRAGDLTLEGGATLSVAAASVPAAGLRWGASRVDLAAQGKRLAVTQSFLAPEGRGAHSLIRGSLDASGPALRLEGDGLLFDTGRGLTGQGDAAVDIVGQWASPRLTGTVAVRHADFAPLGKKEKRKADAAAAKPRRPSAAAMDLRFTFDRDVWYKEKATAIEMKGDVRLKKEPGEPARLLGTVETVRGAYVYFGRVFEVERGTLRFVGQTPMEALLEARARYVDESTRTRIFLQLSGTLREPHMALSSQPEMNERDVLSFLVFGRPLYAVGAGERRASGDTQEAARVIAVYISQGLRRYLPPQLGLDVFRVGTAGGRTDVTVGRYLTRRLFISYGQTLGQDGEKRLNTAYTVSPHVSVETQNTSQGKNVIDLLFNFGFR